MPRRAHTRKRGDRRKGTRKMHGGAPSVDPMVMLVAFMKGLALISKNPSAPEVVKMRAQLLLGVIANELFAPEAKGHMEGGGGMGGNNAGSSGKSTALAPPTGARRRPATATNTPAVNAATRLIMGREAARTAERAASSSFWQGLLVGAVEIVIGAGAIYLSLPSGAPAVPADATLAMPVGAELVPADMYFDEMPLPEPAAGGAGLGGAARVGIFAAGFAGVLEGLRTLRGALSTSAEFRRNAVMAGAAPDNAQAMAALRAVQATTRANERIATTRAIANVAGEGVRGTAEVLAAGVTASGQVLSAATGAAGRIGAATATAAGHLGATALQETRGLLGNAMAAAGEVGAAAMTAPPVTNNYNNTLHLGGRVADGLVRRGLGTQGDRMASAFSGAMGSASAAPPRRPLLGNKY